MKVRARKQHHKRRLDSVVNTKISYLVDQGSFLEATCFAASQECDEGTREYAEFLHLPRNRFTDFVVNLTLIDLPGLTKVVVEGQPDNILHGIDNMVRSYIEKGIENGLHFAVVTIF